MSDFSKKLETTHIAYLHETWRESLARDVGSALTYVSLWSLGYFTESSALQWVGVLIGLVFMFLRISAVIKGATDKRMTPDQAREWLDENFPQSKEGSGG